MKATLLFVVLVCLSQALCFLRLAGEKAQWFQAAAHVTAGFLLAGFVFYKPDRWFYLALLGLISAVEVTCFFFLV